MRIYFLIFFVTVFVSCSRHEPELIMDFDELILDSIVHNRTSYFSIDLKNIGKKNLEILSIEESCGCVKLKDNRLEFPMVIPPNQRKSLEFSVHVNSFGFFLQTLKFRTNDPNRSIVLKVVRGRIYDD